MVRLCAVCTHSVKGGGMQSKQVPAAILILLLARHITAISASRQPRARVTAYLTKNEVVCRKVRFATFNASLNRDKAGQLLQELQSGESVQAANVSHILQLIKPDILLVNEFDYEPNGEAVQALQDKFLAVPQAEGLEPLKYEYVYVAPVNTGIPSGRDFNHDGQSKGPQDCFGFGNHPGQYGMVVLSKFPIDASSVRTFQYFLWKDMPGAVLPTDPITGQPWYSEEDLQVFRLSSKSHWDVPIDIPLSEAPTDCRAPTGCNQPTKRVHMLLHHPTPPAFDGPEQRNVLRNHDEIRLWADYVGCGSRGAEYLYDDNGLKGGLAPASSFVIMGDHNADPLDGGTDQHAINQLLECCHVNAGFVPISEGGREAGNRRRSDRTPPETKTSSFDLRVDYVLPSRDLPVLGGAVWWPSKSSPLSALLEASDHRPVYLDVMVCADGYGSMGAV